MNTRTLLSLVVLFAASATVSAQRVLEFQDVSRPGAIYSGAEDEACIEVHCSHNIPLTFSSFDAQLQPRTISVEGTDSVYYLVVKVANNTRNRDLKIYARGYKTLFLQLGDMTPHQLLVYQVTDPNSEVDAGCYREHRNRGVAEIKNSNYNEARAQFVVARDCSDVDEKENERNIALVDSILSKRAAADAAMNLLDYQNAQLLYAEVIKLNPYDRYANEKRTDCQQRYRSECNMLFTQAEFYFNDKQFNKAEELYRRIVRNGCSEAVVSTERLTAIQNRKTTKAEHARVLSYEYMQGTPFGIHYGKYNLHRAGGFINLNMSGNLLKFLKGELTYLPYVDKNGNAYPAGDEHYTDDSFQDYPEVNVNFGWTVKIANPVWIYFGPGFTSKFYFGHFKDSDGKTKYPGYNADKADNPSDGTYNSYDDGKKNPKSASINTAFAVSPTIGLTVKYSWFALRLGYEYRIGLRKVHREFIGENRLTLGIGVAF